MEKNNMTAVEWFAKEINNMNVSREATLFINKLKEQAKKMEKEQIIGTYVHLKMKNNKLQYGMKYVMKLQKIEDEAEQYYNETFGKS